MGTANFCPLTNPSGPKAGRMRIREGKLPACGIQLKKKNKQRKRRKTRRTKKGTVQLVFGGSPAVFVTYDHRVFGKMHRTENEKLQRINDKMWDVFY